MIQGAYVIFWSIALMGPGLLTYLSYQKFIRETPIIVRIIAPIFIFAVSFAVILISTYDCFRSFVWTLGLFFPERMISSARSRLGRKPNQASAI